MPPDVLDNKGNIANFIDGVDDVIQYNAQFWQEMYTFDKKFLLWQEITYFDKNIKWKSLLSQSY